MEYRKLGGTGVRVSSACLGTAFRAQDDEQLCIRVIDRALDAGVRNYVGGNCTVSLMLMALGGLFRAGLVECIRGRIFDVIVDLRPDSVTFRDWFGIQLSAQAANMLYVPRHFAHGFQTLTDDCEIRYLVNGFYAPEAAAGLRWDDPVLGIEWPLDVNIMSDRDRVWPLLEII